ncbi:MAG: hypothetical protein NWF01_05800 [Candidatus Bathyarchaeota archaeon]|nr:hypothetical protein [Candidatus Bathyarchaeota archaeon]
MPVMASDKLLSVLNVFQPLLNSIDIRTVAIRNPSNNIWTNLLTSVFVTNKTVETVLVEHERLPTIRNNDFMLLFRAEAFDLKIFNEFVEGALRFYLPEAGDIRIPVRKFSPLDLKVLSSRKRMREQIKWVINASGGNQEPDRSSLWSIVSNQHLEAKRWTYSGVIELLKDVLDIDNISSGDGRDFEITVFNDIKLQNARFVGKAFQVEVVKSNNLERLQLNFNLQREDAQGYSQRTIWRTITSIEDGKQQEKDNSDIVKIVVTPSSVLPFDHMDVELIHSDAPFTIDDVCANAPLENVVEPLLKTLSAFCSFEDFKNMLLEPEHYGKQPQKIFENAVTWLLSLAGFSAIHLGVEIKTPYGKKSFDTLSAVESSHNIGSADIIAYEDNKRVLLIDCDIGPLDDKKIGMLLETRKHFESSNNFGQVSFVPVLCTPKDCQKLERRGVIIFDKGILEDVFEDLLKGNRNYARENIIERVANTIDSIEIY